VNQSADKSEGLKKCPFCAGEAEIKGIKGFDMKVIIAAIFCKQCGASTKNYGSINGAIEAWNGRVQEQKECDEG
jgi:Lar family restriction alleviation protein